MTIILRGAASIDNWHGNALRTKLKPLALFTPTDQMRSMLSFMVEVEGSVKVRTVDSSLKIPVCCKSAPIASQNPRHTTAFHSKPKVRIDNDVKKKIVVCYGYVHCASSVSSAFLLSFTGNLTDQLRSEAEGMLCCSFLLECQCWYFWIEYTNNHYFALFVMLKILLKHGHWIFRCMFLTEKQIWFVKLHVLILPN